MVEKIASLCSITLVLLLYANRVNVLLNVQKNVLTNAPMNVLMNVLNNILLNAVIPTEHC